MLERERVREESNERREKEGERGKGESKEGEGRERELRQRQKARERGSGSSGVWSPDAAQAPMQTARRRLLQALLLAPSLPPSSSLTTFARWSAEPLNCTPDGSFPRATLDAPWAAIQTRGAKVLGLDVRLGNVIQRKGRNYQVLKAQHTAGKGKSHHTGGTSGC